MSSKVNVESEASKLTKESWPDARGHFGPYGGCYVPETLYTFLQDVESE